MAEPRLTPGPPKRLLGVKPPAAMLYKADVWYQRFEAGDLDKPAALALLRWLEQDPRHVEAFKAAAREKPGRGVGDVLTHIDRANQGPLAIDSRPPRRWPRVLLLLVFLIVAGVIAYAVWKDPTLQDLPQRLAASYAAPSGQTRQVVLPDGSEVLLGSETAINTRFETSERYIEFLGGEALFQVSDRDNRPFVVRAPKVTVEAIGTRFLLRDDGRKALVTVREGAVRIEPVGRPGHATVIPSNAAVSVEETAGPLLPAGRGEPDAWRHGRLPEGETTLGGLVEGLLRYTPGTILLLRSGAAALPVTGPFETADVAATLREAVAPHDLRVISVLSGAVVILY